MKHHPDRGNYVSLLLMLAASFTAMYGLMFAMVDSLDNMFRNLNQLYMAGLMTAPMAIFELWLMRPMYQDKKANAVVASLAAIAFIGCLVGIRGQAGVSDREFLRSMIPHHAAALLMCEKADLKDPEIKNLCLSIIESQQYEIDLMKEKLKR